MAGTEFHFKFQDSDGKECSIICEGNNNIESDPDNYKDTGRLLVTQPGRFVDITMDPRRLRDFHHCLTAVLRALGFDV